MMYTVTDSLAAFEAQPLPVIDFEAAVLEMCPYLAYRTPAAPAAAPATAPAALVWAARPRRDSKAATHSDNTPVYRAPFRPVMC